MDHTLTTSSDRTLFGFWLYILSDCVLFAGLFATYAILRTATFGGPGPAQLLDLPYVLAETIVLLLSNFAMGIALTIKRTPHVTAALALSLGLGLVFLGLEIHEFAGLIAAGHGPSQSAFLSAFFGLVGTHGLHVAAGSLWMIATMIRLWARGVESSRTRLMMLGLFWHFLDIIWICIFSVVYLLSSTL